MNFVAQLEDYLRDLGAEARKKHPGKLQVNSISLKEEQEGPVRGFSSLCK
jgi:hypothetical protein